MANHGVIIQTKYTAENVDAYNLVGIYKEGDMDNGVLVTLKGMNKDENGFIEGYEYEVEPAKADSLGVCVVKTPAVGTNLEMIQYADPRAFYNEKGRPMSLARLMAGIDYIEVDANCFVGGTAPTAAQNFVGIGANGKLSPANSAPATGCYFTVEGKHRVAVGQDIMTTYVLLCARN